MIPCIQIRELPPFNGGRPVTCKLREDCIVEHMEPMRGASLLLYSASQIDGDSWALAGADPHTRNILNRHGLRFISSKSVEPLPSLKLEDVIVVSNSFDYQPEAGLVVPYILAEASTESDCKVFHSAICEAWRFSNIRKVEPTTQLQGPSLGLLTIREPLGKSYLTPAQRDDLYERGLNPIHLHPGLGFVVMSSWLWLGGRAGNTHYFPATDETVWNNSLVSATLNAMYYHNVDLTYPIRNQNNETVS